MYALNSENLKLITLIVPSLVPNKVTTFLMISLILKTKNR